MTARFDEIYEKRSVIHRPYRKKRRHRPCLRGGIRMKATRGLLLVFVLAAAGCSRASSDVDPKAIEAKYGLSGGYVSEISTEDGDIQATIIPTTLDDGRAVQLVIPHRPVGDHQIYMRDGITITPLELSDPKVSKERFVESKPRVVERRAASSAPAATSKKKRSLEKEVLIVGGSAGAGAAIGAVAGGGKGAAVGALSGGVAGLVYDLATRNKK